MSKVANVMDVTIYNTIFNHALVIDKLVNIWIRLLSLELD